MNVMKAEDIDGHNADIDINSVLEVITDRRVMWINHLEILQSIGEKVDEEKKPKKKVKEKVEKSKTTKKEKKKSPDPSGNDEAMEEEQQQLETEEEEEIPVKVPKGVRNKFVEDELMSFKENFYLVETGNNP